MARPLPKMKAPALRKNRPRATSVPVPAAVTASSRAGLDSTGSSSALPPCPDRRASRRGRASRTIMSRPATMNSTATSAPVIAVTRPTTKPS